MFPSILIKDYPEVTRFLTNAITSNKLANSYIFIGKDSNVNLLIAVSLAKILNCKENIRNFSTPCNKCTNCKWLEKKEHPQALISICPDLKSKKEQIKIDAIRELLDTLKTTSAFFRIIFFENSNLLAFPAECCNLLLKIVEETPDNTVFIFSNSTKNDILPTILSRSQTVYINKKYDAIGEAVYENYPEINNITPANCFSSNIKEGLEKAKITKEYLEKNESNLKNYLVSMALKNYDLYKNNRTKEFCLLFNNLSEAYLKHKAFMQQKFVIEDLFLNLSS